MVSKKAQAMLLGLLCASIGFSYSLATSGNGAAVTAQATATLGVGTGLAYSNPYLLPGQDPAFPSGGQAGSDPNGYDLGDAFYGSSIVRYLTALGGVQPYAHLSSNASALGLTVGVAGRVFGAVPTLAGTFADFNDTLTDASGVTRTGVFHLGTFVPVPGVFRFAHDRLSDARVGMDYITNIEVLGGDATTVFSVVPGSATFNSAAVTDIETLGFRLFADGTIAGRPLQSGTLTFTARASKSSGAIANNRSNAAPDQPLTINISAMTDIESVLATNTAELHGSLSRTGKDTFTYSAFINTNGFLNSSFAAKTFTFRFAGKTFTTALDSFGQSRGGSMRVNLDAFGGFVQVRLLDQDFSAAVSALPDKTPHIFAVEMQIGETFLGAEPVQFTVVNRNGRYRLSYALGRATQVGGLFQFLEILGSDSFNNQTSFRTKFLLSQVPSVSGTTFGVGNDLVVNIGPAFTEEVPLFGGTGFYNPPGISRAIIFGNDKVGFIYTYPLSKTLTGITTSRQANGQPQTFLMGVKITTNKLTFDGAASLKIFPF